MRNDISSHICTTCTALTLSWACFLLPYASAQQYEPDGKKVESRTQNSTKPGKPLDSKIEALNPEDNPEVFFAAMRQISAEVDPDRTTSSQTANAMVNEKVASYISAHGAEKMSASDLACYVRILELPRDKIALDQIKQAKTMAGCFGAIKKEFKKELANKSIQVESVMIVGKMSPERQAEYDTKMKQIDERNEAITRQRVLKTMLPSTKRITMDSILAAFTYKDAKRKNPDFLYCVEKADLTKDDKKELMVALHRRITNDSVWWAAIRHPADEAAREKEREKRKQEWKKTHPSPKN